MQTYSPEVLGLTARTKARCREMNAVFLAHNYQRPEVQDAADIVGDSLALSAAAAKTRADVILFAGVHFMAETAKILSPGRLVLMPRPDAGCPMADMIDPDSLAQAKKKYPDHAVVTYVNSTAAVKAMSDIICTSANAVAVVEAAPGDKILFTPDRNLADWVSRFTKKEVVPFPGYCPTHERLTASMVFEMKSKFPDAEIVVHPECRPEVCDLADAVRSTSGMLKYCHDSPARRFLIGTEEGLLHRLRKESPDKEFILINKTLICPNMKFTTLEDCLDALDNPAPHEITVADDVLSAAKRALDRMLAVK